MKQAVSQLTMAAFFMTKFFTISNDAIFTIMLVLVLVLVLVTRIIYLFTFEYSTICLFPTKSNAWLTCLFTLHIAYLTRKNLFSIQNFPIFPFSFSFVLFCPAWKRNNFSTQFIYYFIFVLFIGCFTVYVLDLMTKGQHRYRQRVIESTKGRDRATICCVMCHSVFRSVVARV